MRSLRFNHFEVVAHRGARTLSDPSRIAPENTLSAFKTAVDLDASLELDVMATRDGTLVVYHDKSTGQIFSLPNGEKAIPDVTFKTIQQATLNPAIHEAIVQKMMGSNDYRLNPAFQSVKIPTLASVISQFPKTYIYIELKTQTAQGKLNNQLEERIVQLIQRQNLYHRTTVISFHWWSLLKSKWLDPKIQTGLDCLFPSFFKTKGQRLFLDFAKYILRVKSIHPPYEAVTTDLVTQAHNRGLKIIPWVHYQTRQEEQILFPKLIGMGVDGLITNAVDLLQEYLAQNKPSSP